MPTNKRFQQLEGVLSSFEPNKERIATNVDLALRDVDPPTLERFAGANPTLAANAFFLKDRRERARLRLPKDMENLAADLSVDGIHAWSRLYDRISGALRVQVMERGEVVSKSPGQVQLDSPERTVRQNNFYASDKAWSEIGDTCADALNHITGTRLTLYRRLGLPSHLEAPLKYNRMTRATLDAMWSTVASRKRVLLKYMAKKAELLGLDRLAWYDLQAPLPQAAQIDGERLTVRRRLRPRAHDVQRFLARFRLIRRVGPQEAVGRGREPRRQAAGRFLHGISRPRANRGSS